jgi:hypothetical protein
MSTQHENTIAYDYAVHSKRETQLMKAGFKYSEGADYCEETPDQQGKGVLAMRVLRPTHLPVRPQP